MWLLVFPVAVEEGVEAWQRWLGISDLHKAVHEVNILYQKFGWASILLAVAATLLWWFYWYPPRLFQRWKEDRRRARRRRTTESSWSSASTEGQMPDLPLATEPIPPEKTITEHGVLTMGPSGYPERLTTWEDMKRGELAPAPAGPPPRESQEAELWKVSPGAGRTVARAIMEAESLETARGIFDAHRASPNPKDTAWAAYALMTRMEVAGEGEDVTLLAHQLIEEGIDITDSLPVMEHDPIFRERVDRSN